MKRFLGMVLMLGLVVVSTGCVHEAVAVELAKDLIGSIDLAGILDTALSFVPDPTTP